MKWWHWLIIFALIAGASSYGGGDWYVDNCVNGHSSEC